MTLRNKLSVGAFLLAGSLCAHTASAFALQRDWIKSGWEAVSERDGIKTFAKSVPGTDVKGVGGEATIDAPIGKILWVLMDHDHKKDWIDKFREAKTVEEMSPTLHIQYAAFDLPFPASDREFVYSYDFKVDKSNNAVVVEVKSVTNPKAPAVRDGDVRGEIIDGRYVLVPKGDKTFVQAEYLADPKGALPTFVVNLVQKK